MSKTGVEAHVSKLLTIWHRFRRSSSGQIAVIFALASTAIVVATGAGIDLSRGYIARQRLSQVATLTCQFSTRPSVVQTANTTYSGTNGFQTYLNAVNSFAATSLTSQHWSGTLPTASAPPNGPNPVPYFTATAASGSGSAPASYAPSNAVTELFATVPTTFLNIIHVSTMAVHAKVSCNEAGTTPQIVNPGTVLQEGFETSCAYYCDTNPSGGSGNLSTPTSTIPSTPSYTGATGTQFYITGYCLEIDHTGVINSTSPEGSHTAELDCDNGSGTAGNSSITSKVYLEIGNYELRYFYRSRVFQQTMDPAYVCGSTAGDVAFVSPTTTVAGRAIRTNQINVYLDQVGASPPYHTTQDGTQTLSGTNLIDTCVYSQDWVERSVKIVVTAPAFYWLSFAADGANDSYGGQLDNIRVCQELCAGTPKDDFPSAWTTLIASGTPLFKDTFHSAVPYVANTAYSTDTAAYLASATSITSISQAGWPYAPLTGWATAPNNQITYVTQGGSGSGGQYIELDNCATTCSNGNRSISRGFLLDPGYYQITYNYMSMTNFTGSSGSYCYYPYTYNPTFGSWGTQTVAPTLTRYHPTTPATTANGSTNILEVFMANGQSISTPIADPTQISQTATNYYNPGSSTPSSTATYPPDSINSSAYNYNQVNPMLDTCGYSANYVWLPRTVNIKIVKTGVYWLTFSANQSAADGAGAGIDGVTLSAIGSYAMANPPVSTSTLSTVQIPAPSPQPDTIYNNSGAFTGFYIIANPFNPPAADQ